MLYLNFSNVEDLIFFDTQVQKLLPIHMFSYFEQWRLAKRVPFLREIGKQAILDFLNSVGEDEIEILERHFQDKIIVEKLNYNMVLNVEVPLTEKDVCLKLCDLVGFNYYSMWRDDKHLYISFWR